MSERVQRFDSVELRLDKAVHLDNGWVRAPSAIGRVGVFEYLDKNGAIVREYRPPEEVFDAESLASFDGVPLTNDHPQGRLDATNTAQHIKGSVSGPTASGDHVLASVVVYDAQAVADAKSGKRMLSPGYTVELDPTPGVTPAGEKYDAVQRKIRGNHVALVQDGRQGESVALRMDSGARAQSIPHFDDAESARKWLTRAIERHERHMAGTEATSEASQSKMMDEMRRALREIGGKAMTMDGSHTTREDHMSDNKDDKGAGVGDKADAKKLVKVKAADGTEYEVPSAVAKLIENLGTKVEKNDELRGRCDALETENRDLKAKLAQAEQRSDAKVIDARIELVANAKRVCGDSFKADGKPDVEVMRAVIEAVDPSAKDACEANKADAGYIRGRYEVALEKHAARKDTGTQLLNAARKSSGSAPREDEVSKAKAKAEADRNAATPGLK